MKTKINKSKILKFAWQLYNSQANKASENFSMCLKKAWYIAKNGDDCYTFNDIYNKYYKKFYRYVLLKVKKTEIAEEINQEIFVKLYKNFDNYDVYRAKLLTWLYTIANNLIIDFYRTNHSNIYINTSNFIDDETGREIYQFVAPNTFENDNILENKELKAKIENAFSELKPKYKKIANLYFIEGKSYNEIVDICNIPIGTVKGMISRCRGMLQNKLQGCYKIY